MPISFWNRVAQEVEDFRSTIRELPVIQPVTPGQVRDELNRRFDPARPLSLDDTLDRVIPLLRDWTVHVTHPRYFGLFNPSVTEASIAADTLAAVYNPQLAAWSHSPAANEMERWTLRQLTSRIAWDPDDSWANFTSGGAEANASAVWTAVAHWFPETVERGLYGLASRPAMYVTSDTHHSLAKACKLAGLGAETVRSVPTNAAFQLDVGALCRQVEADRKSGWRPWLIAATAGTTGSGVVDPLTELARVASENQMWLHVDAAWGAGALMSDRLRSAVDGLQLADSITWDAHKWLSVPMAGGMFFCRHPQSVRRAFSQAASYMPGNEGAEDPYNTTPQWSRRAIGLKVFMSLVHLGWSGYQQMIEHQAAMGDRLREMLLQHDWVLVNRTPLPVVCFADPHRPRAADWHRRLLQWIYRRGRVWISAVLLGNTTAALRACITSYQTNEDDLQVLLSELNQARREVD